MSLRPSTFPRGIEPAQIFAFLARSGYVARGVVYFLIGFLVLYSGQANSMREVLEFIHRQLFGQLLVATMALGLFGYGLWRLVSAWFDVEDKGDKADGVAIRIGHAGSGLVHMGLALFAAALAAGMGFYVSSSGAETSQEVAGEALKIPGGGYVLAFAGLFMGFVGLMQIIKGVRARFEKYFRKEDRFCELIKWLGRLGYSARGSVFVLVGWFVIKAGMAVSPSSARTPSEVLGMLAGWPSTLIAAGFVLFGMFSWSEAVYRQVMTSEVRQRLNAMRS